MTWRLLAAVALFSGTMSGCASDEIFKHTLTKLEESRDDTAKVAAALADFKQQAAMEIRDLQVEQSRLARQLMQARSSVGDTQSDLESTEYHLDSERQTVEQMMRRLLQLEGERTVLDTIIAELEKRLGTSQDTLGRTKEAQGRALAQIEFLEGERDGLSNELVVSQNTVLQTQLSLEVTQGELAATQRGRDDAERQLARIEKRERTLQRLSSEVRRERDFLHERVESLKQGLETAHAALSRGKVRMADLQREKQRAKAALAMAQHEAALLEAALASEQKHWIRLQKALATTQEPIIPVLR